MKITPNTWIVSDTHFFHKNIVKYANRPMNHNELMEKNWRAVVGENEDILHLGDVHVWYEKEDGVLDKAAELIKSLPGNKYLIKGNHDKFEDKWYEDMGFKIIEDNYPTMFDQKVLVFSHYPNVHQTWHVNIHGHIHINGYLPECNPEKDYRNVSIEVMDYRPARLHEIWTGKYRGIVEQGYDTHKLKKRRR